MKITAYTASKSLTISLGNYESVKIHSSITAEYEQDDTKQEVMDKVNDMVNNDIKQKYIKVKKGEIL